MTSTPSRYSALKSRLQSAPAPLLAPVSPVDSALTDAISSLQVHPALEAALHLLNGDLYSAHFLCRHMQAPPAWEGMYLHGILHRIEGDYDNARAWYRDVARSDVFRAAWGGVVAGGDNSGDRGGGGGGDGGEGSDHNGPLDRALAFIADVEALSRQGASSKEIDGDHPLVARSGREIEAVLAFCEDKFGTDRIVDATACWTQPDGEHKKLGQEMVSGDKGRRKF